MNSERKEAVVWTKALERQRDKKLWRQFLEDVQKLTPNVDAAMIRWATIKTLTDTLKYLVGMLDVVQDGGGDNSDDRRMIRRAYHLIAISEEWAFTVPQGDAEFPAGSEDEDLPDAPAEEMVALPFLTEADLAARLEGKPLPPRRADGSPVTPSPRVIANA